ncbi:MAG TPA: kelch repeat-containing protein [Myxococcaceae bacterium]|nr:kelch repeat-containing protein [Myxococcaceae bacterium]
MRRALLPLLLTVLAGCGLEGGDHEVTPGWYPRTSMPTPRQENGVAAIDDHVYVVGGFNLDGPVLAVNEYQPASNAWREVAPLPEPLHGPNVAAAGGRLYVLGGLNRDGAVGRAYVYDPGTNAWSERASMPEGTERGAAGVAVVDKRIYILGGLRDGAVTDASVYDTERDTWTSLPALPAPRAHLVAGAANGHVYAIGGRGNRLFSDVDLLEPITGSWIPRNPMPTARASSAVAVLNDRIYVFGGEGARKDPFEVFSTAESYDAVNDEWRMLSDMRTPRHCFGGAAVEAGIYLPGGANRQGPAPLNLNELYVP